MRIGSIKLNKMIIDAESGAGVVPNINALALDLRDALAEIERLRQLSQSQAEALDMMERGKI